MSIASKVLQVSIALSVVSAAFYIGGIYEKENQASETSQIAETRVEVEPKVSKPDPVNDKLMQDAYIKKITRWTEGLEYLPKSKERNAFSSAIIQATSDGVITKAEYQALAKQNYETHHTIMNSQSKENAANIRDGYSIVDYRDGIKEGADQPNSVFAEGLQRQRIRIIQEGVVLDFEEADANAFAKREQHPKAVSDLVYTLGSLPSTIERQNLSEDIIVVLKDNKITDDEYKALENKMSVLVTANKMRIISNKANRLAADDGY